MKSRLRIICPDDVRFVILINLEKSVEEMLRIIKDHYDVFYPLKKPYVRIKSIIDAEGFEVFVKNEEYMRMKISVFFNDNDVVELGYDKFNDEGFSVKSLDEEEMEKDSQKEERNYEDEIHDYFKDLSKDFKINMDDDDDEEEEEEGGEEDDDGYPKSPSRITGKKRKRTENENKYTAHRIQRILQKQKKYSEVYNNLKKFIIQTYGKNKNKSAKQFSSQQKKFINKEFIKLNEKEKKDLKVFLQNIILKTNKRKRRKLR